MSTPADQRCWCYGSKGCRARATHSVRIKAHVYHYCDNPGCKPVIQGPIVRSTP